jgi:hypothetical protein
MPKPYTVVLFFFVLAVGAVKCGAFAQEDEAAGKMLLKKLQGHLAKDYADSDRDSAMSELVDELAKLKFAPAKKAIYETVFFWFGFDDTMTAHPRLFTLKEKLEADLNKRALEATADLKDVKANCLVFLDNRKELAVDPNAASKYSVLVLIHTTTRFDGDGGTQKREQIAAKLKIPVHRVGLEHGITKQGRDVRSFFNNVDARLDTQPAYFLMGGVCEFLKHSHDANDDRFLRWAVDHRRLSRGLASELIPKLFPPVKRPDPVVQSRDAQHLAVKVFTHYGLAKVKKFTRANPGSFKALLDSGVLSKEDGAKMALHGFEEFRFRKNVAFSRRYEFSLYYTVEEDTHVIGIGFNHLGKVVEEDKETDTSSDIAADVKIMWSVDEKGRSPQEAIEAASRVFNTVKLEGMHREKIFKQIGHMSLRPKGIYNRPFWPVAKDELAFRFDTGAYGWQFNLKFDEKEICKTVTRKWIH